MKTSRIVNLKEFRWEPLYDTAKIPAGSLTTRVIPFFSVPISGSKTKTETNMVNASQLPKPQVFRCYGIRMEAFVTDHQDHGLLEKLASDSWVRFFVGTKNYLEVPLQTIVGGVTVIASGMNEIAGSVIAHAQLGAAKSAGYKFPRQHFIDIVDSENFGVEWTINTNLTVNTETIFKIYLDGFRGVDVR